MWMMGYNDGGDFNMPDSFNGRKLRPLMPRVPHPPNPTANPTNYLRSIHGDNFIALNHHQLAMSEQNKRDFHTQQLVVSSRWNPTPEQLQTLEELYRRGTRTPSAEQIQHITAQLRRYGKIEGKNVFYWFQNHKARERQKRRRQLESAANGAAAGGDDQSHSNCNAENTERKESGANRTVFEIEQTKHWPSPTNCSTIPEKTAATTKAMAAAAAAAGGVAESCRAAAEKWIPFDEGEQRRSLLAERNATWQMMHLSCSTPNNTNTIHLMNNNSTSTICSNIVTATSNPITSSCPSTPRTMDHQPKQLFKPKDHLNIFIAPFRSACDQKQHENIVNVIGDDDEEGHGESQTLELFPLRSSSDNNDENIFCDKDEIGAAANSNNNFNGSHYQFFEFLPLKN